MEARAGYYHVLLRAVKDGRGRFRPVISDANARWREVSNEGFRDENDARDSAELMALAYVRKQQPDTTWAKLRGVEWHHIEGEVCDFCDAPAQTARPDATGIPMRLCQTHAG
ncbi:MAG TPA: hypothetical protein VFL57_16935 [Bryobacteraceae bacterium]|nr:hypothetical protein [Bryobacteraceae bacterium]